MGSIFSSTYHQPRQPLGRSRAEPNLQSSFSGKATTRLEKSNSTDYQSSPNKRQTIAIFDKSKESLQATSDNRKTISLMKRSNQSRRSPKADHSDEMNVKKHATESKSSCDSSNNSPGIPRPGTIKNKENHQHHRYRGSKLLESISPNHHQQGCSSSDRGRIKNSLKSVSSLQRKLRSAKPSRELSRKVNIETPALKQGVRSLADNTDEAIPISKEKVQVSKITAAPPGAPRGTLPLTCGHSEQSSMHQCHPTYQPVPFSHLNLTWSYQGGMYPDRSRYWAMPDFLAPFATTVCPTETTTNELNGIDYCDVDEDMNSNSVDQIHPTPFASARSSSNKVAAAKSIADDIGRAVVTGMIDDNSSAQGRLKISCQDNSLPSTFAPPEYVEQITKRQNNAKKAKSHSIGSKSVYECGEVSSMRSSAKLSKNKAAYQAASPVPISRNGRDVEVASDVNEETMTVMTVLGKRVTIVDAERKIFVIDLLSPETCDEIRQMADDHVAREHKNGGSKTWRTLYTYTKMDLPVVEVKNMAANYTDYILHAVKKIIGEVHGVKDEAMKLRQRSWKEPHLLLYQAVDGKPHHTGIEMHYDGCDYTCEILF
mmetsp:Transcript_11689/g.21749  ORF Transcript_11689/g.21749 Transcript_11689/m.21749 type:complete len:598 (+) Transcript_11689:103-1896(+)